MSFWNKPKVITRDVPTPDYKGVEYSATQFLALLEMQGLRGVEIKILVPSYKKKGDRGNDEIVETHYSNITELDFPERYAIEEDNDKRGCVTVQMKGIGITEEFANKVFDGLTKARW